MIWKVVGAGRHVGEAADILAANFKQACNRATAADGLPAARLVWPLGGLNLLRLVCGKVFAAEAGEDVTRRSMSM